MWPFSSKARKAKKIKALFAATPVKPGLFADPVKVDFSILEFCDMTGYFAYGIFNPMGPTICIVSLLRHETADKSLLHFLMLNPFGQESVVLGSLPRELKKKQLMETIPEAFAINDFTNLTLVGGLPTFLLHGGSEESLKLGRSCLSLHVSKKNRVGEVAKELGRLKEFKGRPWDRASSDMKQAMMDVFLAKAASKGLSLPQASEPISGGNKTSAWLDHLTSEGHLKSELAGFLQGWQGSIVNLKGSQVARSSMSFDSMITNLTRCNLAFTIAMLSASREMVSAEK